MFVFNSGKPAIVQVLFKGDEATIRTTVRLLGTPTPPVLSFKLALVRNEPSLKLWDQCGHIYNAVVSESLLVDMTSVIVPHCFCILGGAVVAGRYLYTRSSSLSLRLLYTTKNNSEFNLFHIAN